MAATDSQKRAPTAVDAAWSSDRESKLARSSGDQSLAGQVRKAIYSNLKMRGVSPEALDGRRRNGVTMREQVEIDKKKNMVCKGSVKMGKVYWDNLRTAYMSKASASQRLAIDDGSRPTDDLWQVLRLYSKPPCNRQVLRQWLSTQTEMTFPNFKATGQCLLRLKPSASLEQLQTCKDLIDAWYRCRCHISWPEEFGLLRGHIDAVGLQVLSLHLLSLRKKKFLVGWVLSCYGI